MTPTDDCERDLCSCADGWPCENTSGCDRRERVGGIDKNELASSVTGAMVGGPSLKIRSMLLSRAPTFSMATSDWESKLARISAMQVRISRISL